MEACKSCGCYVKIIARIEDTMVIEKFLKHLERKDATATVRSPDSVPTGSSTL
jgi:hypothetical protein